MAGFGASATRWQWRRGARALFAIGSVMTICYLLGKPAQAAALGAFDALLVDNGGPYRPRLTTMATVLVGGALALVAGSLVPSPLWFVLPATLAVAWLLTYARVVSQPLASASVLVLVLYFAGLGGTVHTLAGALASAEMVLAGGAWAVLLQLVLWPLDPFRPARLAVAHCYLALAEFTSSLAAGEVAEAAVHQWLRNQRIRIEEARTALAATPARAPSRTVRARNLTVLLETSDMLLARTIRLTELAERASAPERVRELARWLAAAELAMGRALEHRPADEAYSFAPSGSHSLELLRVREPAADALLAREQREAQAELRIGFEALRTIWTGVERARPTVQNTQAEAKSWNLIWIDSGWREAIDAIRANWTMRSANMRHALRLAVVGVVDVIAMRLIHVNHGFWLPMTSIILMQPYSAGTNRKSVQRVTGTIAGGLLAAVLAAAVPGPRAMIVAITLLAALTLATYAVDYAVYCFFLTPTFVLMSLPHLHDWRYAGIRMGTTLAGAAIAIAAMRLLWPERAEAELAALLRRGVAAESAYLRAVAAFLSKRDRKTAEREILAPARRACGLASNDAEEALDRVMQEPHFVHRGGAGAAAEQALTVTTYLRRLTQSGTTLASLGSDAAVLPERLGRLAARLEGLSRGEVAGGLRESASAVTGDAAEEQIERMERQTGVLERTMAGFGG